MFKKRKNTEVKKVIDVALEVKNDFVADKESFSACLIRGFKRAYTEEGIKKCW
ncbi:hypothetical protein KsCSTR_12800 [Candidatus Kuenenia stuttgartiensis]|jgi:hypothetical protein|uniref:Uncharacterized protein n=1 Tax=Kuenenia stuttgartiensis TaxID=174633 RepID=Q1Q0V8_KUEST|nr:MULTISPECIES: hypothetical protein [Kuenenia]MBE7545590.1 hypothetical protein [Planctomycetia bacterium]MBZ0191614.1 hypothetical protein [Candidatus Kuenenia stuttgartiensis]MCL4728763.1 hypothetical protein [Candidatus Kuenenia stuttgartiensis]MCZ7624413.1 hypothetical protein [Candidatus Kuenenia sp.]QII10659.1 hypothetical protein KsCSTR_12800 [Candidatus Kuenenia stuttgartiensis]